MQPSTLSLSVSIGQAGDRSDRDLVELCETIAEAKPARVFLRDMSEYLRGRLPLEVPNILLQTLSQLGLPKSQTKICSSELAALQEALSWAKSGDVVVHLVHTDREAIQAHLQSLDAKMN